MSCYKSSELNDQPSYCKISLTWWACCKKHHVAAFFQSIANFLLTFKAITLLQKICHLRPCIQQSSGLSQLKFHARKTLYRNSSVLSSNVVFATSNHIFACARSFTCILRPIFLLLPFSAGIQRTFTFNFFDVKRTDQSILQNAILSKVNFYQVRLLHIKLETAPRLGRTCATSHQCDPVLKDQPFFDHTLLH